MLGRVLVDELIDDLEALAVRVVDLHERLPFLGQRVLGEDRLDRALRLAGAAVDALLRVDDSIRSTSWMQSTGQTSTQERSLMSMQGSAMM